MRRFRMIWAGCFIVVAAVFLAVNVVQRIWGQDGGPSISVPKETFTVSIEDGEDVLLQDVTAQDGRDGDVTSSVLVESISNFYNGLREVTYAAFDSDGNVTKATRSIQYSDYTAPRFTLSHSLRYQTGEEIDLDELVQATDCLDGDITSKIKVSTDSSLSTRTAGVYQVTFSVTNSAGDSASLTTELEVYDPDYNDADINLSTYLVYCQEGDDEPDYRSYVTSVVAGSVRYTFSEGAASATGSDGSTLRRAALRVRGTADMDTAGVYQIYLTYQGEDYQGTTLLLVVVE
ncbi:MAG: DUF5011 domain-containing protein [Clostridiales bacterium]|nr:DUF5011 domain-containing protein [Clostridiales bacterium]